MIRYDEWLTACLDKEMGEIRPLTAKEIEERQAEEHDRRRIDD